MRASRKPGSVVDDHLSGTIVANGLVRLPISGDMPGQHFCVPLPCSGWGFHGRPVSRSAGALLPHHFNLAVLCKHSLRRCVSVALSLRSPAPDVIRHPCPMEPGLSSRHI